MRKPFKKNWRISEPESQFEGLGIRRVGLCSTDPTSPNLDVLNHGVIKPGLRLPWFYHEKKDEIIIVLKGCGKAHFQEASAIELKEGDILCVPAGVHHSVENTSHEDMEAFFFKVLY